HGQRRQDGHGDPAPEECGGGGGRLGEDDEQSGRSEQDRGHDDAEDRQGLRSGAHPAPVRLGGAHSNQSRMRSMASAVRSAPTASDRRTAREPSTESKSSPGASATPVASSTCSHHWPAVSRPARSRISSMFEYM